MYHFQVGSMGAKLLLIYVLSQTIITASLGGVTLPFSDLVGKVTPIKPKPLSPSTISSLSSTSSPAIGARKFSSPLVLTSTSRALPVPKIDSTSIADVKLPERLREKFVLPKLCCTSITNAKAIPHLCTPDVLLPHKYAFLSAPSKPSNSLPCSSSWNLWTNYLNKISSVSNMESLPAVPIEPFKISSPDILCTGSLPRSRTINSPLALETRKPSFSEQFSSNTFSPTGSSSSLPFPLCYKSTYLPGVRTPSIASPLIFRPISYKDAGNFNSPIQSGSHNLLSPKTFTTSTNVNTLQEKCNPYTSRLLNPIKTAEITEPINPIQLPKTSSNIYVSTKPEFSAKNLCPSLKANAGSASVALLSSTDLKNQKNPFRNSMPNTLADKISDFELKPDTCTLPKIKPTGFQSPPIFTNSPSSSFVPVSPSSPILDVLPNKINSFDCSKNIDRFDIIPITGACVETIDKLDANDDICSNCQIGDYRNVPRLEQINISSSFAPKLASYQHPLFSQEGVSNPIDFPPIIPSNPIPTISSRTSYPPNTFYPSRILQTPSISCISQARPTSIAQTTSNIVSDINDIVSSIAQNILSSFQSYINPAPQNIPQKPATILQPNPCDNLKFISKQTIPVLPSPVNTQSILPITTSPITDCMNSPTVRIPTMSDASCQPPEYEMAASQSLPISLPQPTVAVAPPISLLTFSSPQLCPSYLPSPILPSYPTISSPFYMEAPVYKVSSSKKDSDMEKLVELMLLAEILNNDENFDWDDLDTLLAFLSLS